MKIGIDTLGLNHGISSAGSYLISFLKNLPECPEDIKIEIIGSEIDKYTFTNDSKFVFQSVPVEDGTPIERLWQRYELKKFARKNNYDVLIYGVGSMCCPNPGRIKGVALVHGLISNTIKNEGYFDKKAIIRSLKKASLIFTASEFIKSDLVFLGIKKEKIFVNYIGVDHKMFYPHKEITTDTVTINPFSIKRPFFIYVSSLNDVKKNHINLIRAFELFKEKTKKPHRLVFAGIEGDAVDLVNKAILESNYASDIIVIGHFPYQSLPELYSCAEACVYPSDIEGVGLPVLESMATGIPVLCSKKGALPEIAGGCALLFDSDNPQTIADCLDRITSDEGLRQELVQKGLKRSDEFSMQKNAGITIEMIQKLCKSQL